MMYYLYRFSILYCFAVHSFFAFQSSPTDAPDLFFVSVPGLKPGVIQIEPFQGSVYNLQSIFKITCCFLLYYSFIYNVFTHSYIHSLTHSFNQSIIHFFTSPPDKNPCSVCNLNNCFCLVHNPVVCGKPLYLVKSTRLPDP